MMKKALSFVLAMIMVLSLAACGGKNTADNGGKPNAGTSDTGKTDTQKPDAGKTEQTPAAPEYAEELTIAINFGTLDPGDTWNSQREPYQRLVFDTLIERSDITGEITMNLAKSVEWANDDCSKIHVVLRDDAVFSNGDPVTAADVEFSFARSTYGSMSTYYDSCEIISDTELYINLASPNSAFMPILARACACVVSKAETEKNADGLATIGSGPWVYDMSTYVAKNTVSLVRNENYWGEYENPTKKITFVYIADNSARGIALQSGEINFGIGFGETDLPAIAQKKNLTVVEEPVTGFMFIGFNDRRNTDNLSEEELNLRRAVACAIKKEDVMIGCGYAGGQVMTSMWPYSDPAYIADESEYETDLSYNPEKAKEYLAKAGGKNELTLLVITDYAGSKTAGQIIQEQCRQVGITLNIEEIDGTGFTAMVKSGEVNYDLFVYGNLFVIDVVNWNYYLTTSSVNRAMMNNSKVLEAIDKIKTSSDDAVRTEQLKIMQTEAHEKVSYIPICWKVNNYAYANGLEGFEVSAMPTYNFRNVCLRTN